MLIDVCQYRGVLNQKELRTLESCCTPVTDPLDGGRAAEAAATFKVLSDPVRLRLLALITARACGGEVCVCELAGCFDLSQPTISHHLKVLRKAGLIDCERRGTWVYYWPLTGALATVRSVLAGLSPDESP